MGRDYQKSVEIAADACKSAAEAIRTAKRYENRAKRSAIPAVSARLRGTAQFWRAVAREIGNRNKR